MKEIKFRNWDTIKGKMGCEVQLDKETEKIMMQYIGKQDKNKKDIYEGDYLKAFKRGEEDKEPYIYEVSFLNGCYMIGNWNCQEYFSKFTNIEVIGNKFEGKFKKPPMKITRELKRAFCKNYNIPLKIYREDVFESRLELFDRFYDTKKKWNEFVESLSYYENEQEYFNRRDELIDRVLTLIKNKQDYINFNLESPEFLKPMASVPNIDLGKAGSGTTFFALDMKKANFQALRLYSPHIFDNCKTWEEFLGQFTYDESLKNSKYFRQVVLGNLNPKRIQSLQKKILSTVISTLEEKFNLTCYTNGSDGILIEDDFDFADLKEMLKDCPPIDFSIRRIKIHKLNKEIYKIEVLEGDVLQNPYKGVSHLYLPILIKKELNLPIEEEDLYFISDGGILSKFLEDPLVLKKEEREEETKEC